MDTTPIFELRSQLRSAAIAGADLLSENFRLKKAVGAIEPLKDASPVFGKIYELSNKLVSGESGDAAGTLLDALTLTDSVTVALAGYDVQGDTEDIPLEDFSAEIINAPYSKLSVLINALTKSGGGQYNKVKEAVDSRSELLRDYRVKPALVKGLGASYSDLADMVFGIIENMGEDMLPLLKKGFDPKGKKEMIRRVLLIDTLGKEKANDFYLENLPLAEKNIKKLLVRALRHDVGNADKLIELISTEKGAIKDEAYYTLARLDCDKARGFFEQMEQKKPQETLEYLKYSRTPWASRLAAKIGNRLLDNNDGGDYKMNGLGLVDIEYYAFQGKLGKDVADVIRRICLADDDKKAMRTQIRELVSNALTTTVATTGDPEMCALALELENKYPAQFEETAFYARVIGNDDCTDWLKKKVLEAKKRASKQSNKGVFYTPAMSCMKNIKCADGKYFIKYKVFDGQFNAAEVAETYTLPVNHPVKEKWIDMLFDCDWYMADNFTCELYDPDDEVMREKLKQHYFKRIVEGEDYINYLLMIKALGLKNVEGLVKEYFKANHKKFKDKFNDAYKFLRWVPSDYEYLCKEIDNLESYANSNKIKLNLDLEDIREFIEHFWTEQH